MFAVGKEVHGYFGFGRIIGLVTAAEDDEPRWRVAYTWAVVDEPESDLSLVSLPLEAEPAAHEWM